MPSGRLGEWLAREPCALHAARRHRVEAAREREDGMTIGCLRLVAVAHQRLLGGTSAVGSESSGLRTAPPPTLRTWV